MAEREVRNGQERLTGPESAPEPRQLPFPVVGIGGSAGGLEAFSEFLAALPPDSGMAFVFILHLPPNRESLMADILARRTQMPVQQISNGMPVEPNHVYVIQPGSTLGISAGEFHLSESVGQLEQRHPVDAFLESLAAEQCERSVAVIMSGMGSNGTSGARAIRAAGGLCLAQDPASARFPAMPQSLIDSGMADFVMAISEMPELLLRYVKEPYVRGEDPETLDSDPQDRLHEILRLLRTQIRHDFSGYKHATVLRRIARRMSLKQAATMADYLRLLQKDPAEMTALAEDFLIHTTGFFRDNQVWESLREKVIVPLAAQRDAGSSIRAWVTACASGEEAYTLAMLLMEASSSAGKNFEIKVFATDIAGRSLDYGREASYPASIESEISPERLVRFFERNDGSYRVKRDLRETVVFAPQNILQDPPFSRMDICTCRNLLIYLEPEMQKRALALIHFAVREGGAVLLGKSETVAIGEDMFEPIDKATRIFRRMGGGRRESLDFPLGGLAARFSSSGDYGRASSGNSIIHLTQQILLARHGPPAVVVDRGQRIIYFHGATDRFLGHPRGEPTRDLLALAKDSVRGPLRNVFQEALAGAQTANSNVFRAEIEGRNVPVQLRIVPLDSRSSPSFFLVSFEERPEMPSTAPTEGNAGAERVELERELLGVRDELRGKIQELQSNNEEMKASHEEAISINEELQSTNEELETSKEELQSLNEELTTVNAQLQAKMEELEAATNDLSSLLSSTNIAVIFLDSLFRIRRFTPAIKDLLPLIPSDVGRPLNNIARKFLDDRLLEDAQSVLRDLSPARAEVTSTSGRTYIRSILPYRTKDDRVDGVVMTFVDITERKQAEGALRESEEQLRLMLDNVKEYAIFMLDAAGVITTWSNQAERLLGYSHDEALGRPLALLLSAEEESRMQIDRELAEAKEKGSLVNDGWRIRKDGSRFWGTGVLSAVYDDNARLRGFVKVLRDNTDHKLAEEDLRLAKHKAEAANEAKDQFLATVSHELRTPLSSIVLWANLIDENAPIDGDQVKEVLAAIKRGADEQRELIEDLVDTARIAAGKLHLQMERVDPVGIAGAVVASFGFAARDKGLALESDFDASVGTVSADAVRLKQVMSNLIGNAVKFTPAGGRIRFALERRGDEVTITVSDTGQGFSAEFGSHLFSRFEQAQLSGSRLQGGLGIGLSIAREIVTLHGGSIRGESPGAGQGATFTVHLPLPALARDVSEPAPAPSGAIANALRGSRVLLLEDARDTHAALVAVLQEAGAAVVAAKSARDALDEFRGRRPDVIVSDLGLPDMDGFEFIREIRKIEAAGQVAPVPALALTAYAGEKDARRAIECGFGRCLNKPIEPAKLVGAVASLRPPT